MKKFAKLAAVLMAAAMLLSLCACGNANNAKKTVTLGTSADYPPFEFHMLKDGKDQIVGIDVSMPRPLQPKWALSWSSRTSPLTTC